MARQNVYDYNIDHLDPTAGDATLAGHFDTDKATWFGEETRWDGNNNVSINAGTHGHQGLYRTAGGRWVRNIWSDWVGSRETWEFIDDETAQTWLLHNEYATETIEKYFGALEAERGPGRPEIGPRISQRINPEQLETIDACAKAAGLGRPDLIRYALDAALTKRPVTVELTGINSDAGRPGATEDHITVYDPSGEEIDVVTVPSSEDPEPYDRALIEAGYLNFNWVA